MKEFVGLFVVYDLQTSEVQYQARQMFRDDLPTNCLKDIECCLTACNSDKPDPNYEYVDMYGIVVNGMTEWWEEEE